MGSEPVTPSAGPNRRSFWLVAAGVVVVAVIGWTVWSGRAPTGLEHDTEVANDALRLHHPAAARVVLDQVLAEHPADPRALLLSAQAARRVNACADAEGF